MKREKVHSEQRIMAATFLRVILWRAQYSMTALRASSGDLIAFIYRKDLSGQFPVDRLKISEIFQRLFCWKLPR